MQEKLALLQFCPNYGANKPIVQQHLTDFLQRNGACELQVIGISVSGTQKYNCIQIRGKLPIQVNNKSRPIGFKFILPSEYPKAVPFVFLDEPENSQVVEFVDYVDAGNRIRNEFINMWNKRATDPNWQSRLNINQVSRDTLQYLK